MRYVLVFAINAVLVFVLSLVMYGRVSGNSSPHKLYLPAIVGIPKEITPGDSIAPEPEPTTTPTPQASAPIALPETQPCDDVAGINVVGHRRFWDGTPSRLDLCNFDASQLPPASPPYNETTQVMDVIAADTGMVTVRLHTTYGGDQESSVYMHQLSWCEWPERGCEEGTR